MTSNVPEFLERYLYGQWCDQPYFPSGEFGETRNVGKKLDRMEQA